jgi:ubiquinone/menaquinone biosynthesis C-methylase UbiE
MAETHFPKGSGGFLNPEIVVQGFGLKAGMRVADFGCGAGYFVVPVAQLIGSDGKVSAIDLLEEQLSAVRNRAGIFKLRNITYIQADLENENGSRLDSDSQDMVLVANLLFQVRSKETPIKEAKRVMKEGGKLIVIDWRDDSYFGPKDGRVKPLEIKKMVGKEGFIFEKEFMTDMYHWGMIFRK